MGTLRARIVRSDTGEIASARVRVTAATGQDHAPGRTIIDPGNGQLSFPDAVVKVGPGPSYFLSDGEFEVDLPSGQADVVVERGTEWGRQRATVQIPQHGTVNVEVLTERWATLLGPGWYAGNTHVHYDEREQRAAERLQLEVRAEDLAVLINSRLEREGRAYASNRLPIGLHESSRPDRIIDIGEEIRHNKSGFDPGYGHMLAFHLKSIVEPISRGRLISPADPDYPPLSDACDAAHLQGGIVLGCHNGSGMELPVAAITGRLDGMNLFDPWWMQPEYDVWYGLLNCGIQLPASTGSDWYVSSACRVYAAAGETFSYDSWIQALVGGATVATNGPLLRLEVEGEGPSDRLLGSSSRALMSCRVEWQTAEPIDVVEVVSDGEVVARTHDVCDQLRGELRTSISGDCRWVAARCYGRRRDSFEQPRWAHTSPVYVRSTPVAEVAARAGRRFVEDLERSLDWIEHQGRFETSRQRQLVVSLFSEGRARFAELAK